MFRFFLMIEDPKKIVILERDHTRRDYLRSILETESDQAFCFDRIALCFDNLTQLDPDLIVVGSIPRKGIIRFINAHSATNCSLPSLLMTRDHAIKKYIELCGLNHIQVYDTSLNSRAINRSIKKVLSEKDKTEPRNANPFIVGNSPGIAKLKEILPELNRSRECVMIEGETGTGKEMIARAIHCLSDSQDTFIKLSARDIQPMTDRLGLVDMMEKMIQKSLAASPESTVTIFINEIAFLPDPLQAELLDLFDHLYNSESSSSMPMPEKYRIVASNSVGSKCLLSEKTLRKDLFYRLNVLNVKIDPLRKRREDIPLLTDFFSYRYCNMLGRSLFELSSETIDLFMRYHWPGNTRELESVVKRAVVNDGGEQFLQVMQAIRNELNATQQNVLIEGTTAIDSIFGTKEYLQQIEESPLKDIRSNIMAQVEKKVMQKALDATNWNRKKAAAMLNISYKSMLNKISKYGMA